MSSPNFPEAGNELAAASRIVAELDREAETTA
jgi:hypothetical protein